MRAVLLILYVITIILEHHVFVLVFMMVENATQRVKFVSNFQRRIIFLIARKSVSDFMFTRNCYANYVQLLQSNGSRST